MPRTSGAAYKTVRGLSRGLDLLRALNVTPGGETSVEDLAKRTSLHRTTVRRLLETLAAGGFVRRSPSDDTFRLTIAVRTLSEGFTDEEWVAEAAAPILKDLTRTVVWPSDLCTPDHDAMVIRETTHRVSPLSFHRSMVGVRLPMLTTAVGRAYLAFSPTAERRATLGLIEGGGGQEAALAGDRRHVDRLIRKTRAAGYGAIERERADEPKVSAIAVPVIHDGRVIACISIVFLGTVLSVAEAAEAFLPALKDAAEAGVRPADEDGELGANGRLVRLVVNGFHQCKPLWTSLCRYATLAR